MARLGLQQLWIVLASAAPYLMFAEARSVRRMSVQASDHHGLLAQIVLP
jgi:hypothetical protein